MDIFCVNYKPETLVLYFLLDLMVCNAGIMALPKLEYTEQKFEKQIGVNHMGHAYLCSLLEPLLFSQVLRTIMNYHELS